MYIDSHIHAFADSIAERAVERLKNVAKIEPQTNGTIKGAEELLRKCDIDYGVLLPVATKPSQQTTINNWAREEYKGRFISFGTVHPFAEDKVDEIDRIKSLGLKGVKLHNDYQGVFIFDDACKPIYKRCEELGLPVVFHMGHDPVSPQIHRAMPYDLLELHENYPKLKIIGAHLGGVYAWESVYHYIAGVPNIWLDTAFTASLIDEKLFGEIVKKHGADRILFGSDLPWSNPEKEKALVERLSVSDGDKDKIYWKNTAELLELDI